MVYDDIFDAKNACEHLSGFNVCNRYLVVLYYQPHKVRVRRTGGGGGGGGSRWWACDDIKSNSEVKHC